jgi:glycosyltransferase involved in cell wall biosynthesis
MERDRYPLPSCRGLVSAGVAHHNSQRRSNKEVHVTSEAKSYQKPVGAGSISSVALAIPAYNEADGIAGFMTDMDTVLDACTDQHWFVVVNDVSTDNTAQVLDSLGPQLAGDLITVTNDLNSGHGPTVLTAYRRALETGAEWILQVDGDGQFEAEDIEMLLRHAQAGAAIVTGEREVRFDPWYRTVVTGALSLALRTAFKVKRRDINCPLRLYRADILPAILDQVPTDSLTPHVLMTVLEDRSGHRHVEIPVQHRPRRGDTEIGSTWGDAKNLLIPRKLMVFLKDAAIQLVGFRRAL